MSSGLVAANLNMYTLVHLCSATESFGVLELNMYTQLSPYLWSVAEKGGVRVCGFTSVLSGCGISQQSGVGVAGGCGFKCMKEAALEERARRVS